MVTGDLGALAALAGIMPVYRDQRGTRRETSDPTRRALLAAMGFDVTDEGAVSQSLADEAARRAARLLPEYLIFEPGNGPGLELPAGTLWRLECEDGAQFQGVAGACFALPALKLGIHRLFAGPDLCTLLVAPARLPLPARGWGITLPLFGARAPETGGLGDYDDLRVAISELGPTGAGFVGINPIHAGFPADPAIISPYMPSHRRRFSVAHLHVPGLAGASTGLLIDYAAEWAQRRAALEVEFERAGDDHGFDHFRAQEGAALELFATYQALSERFGAEWSDWPEAYHDPASPAVRRFRANNAGRIGFHAWLQYRAEAQLGRVAEAAQAAGMPHGLYLDLAVGTHPFGAETWAEPETFAHGVSLGAPPDAFSVDGQTWILAPMNPRALIAQSFAPLALTLRKQLQFARLLRVDHILGFDRAFWVPMTGQCPGAYVKMPRDAMLAVVRIEAARAQATIVGEDLGNVPEGLQGDLELVHILGCRLMMFETARYEGRGAADYTPHALASFGTHDLPTWLGWREGLDIGLRQALGSLDETAANHARDGRAYEVSQMDAAMQDTSGHVDAMHGFLGRVASCLVALQIEDILGVKEQPNLPGTVDEYPNWRRRLPRGVRGLGADSAILRAAEIMRQADRDFLKCAAQPK